MLSWLCGIASPISTVFAPVLRRLMIESASTLSSMNARSTSTESTEVVVSSILAMVYWLSMNDTTATESFAMPGATFLRAGGRHAVHIEFGVACHGVGTLVEAKA